MSAEDEIRALLGAYERSLNDSDADLAAACYTGDGVFMPSTLPTISGEGLRDGYAGIFASIRLSLTFTVDELAVASESVAYALTRSTGTQVVNATGAESAESNP
jgi:ketosteroid isomerase-like protein